MYHSKYRHDPIRQVRFLRESIQLGKKPLGIFLGAGCPLAIQVPIEQGSEGQQKAAESPSNPLIPDVAKMTEIILSKLKEDENHKASVEILYSHFSEYIGIPTLENYLSHLRALIDVCGGQEVRGLKSEQMILLEKAICEEIYNLVNVRHTDTNGPYHKLAQWILSANREHNVEIFTTNYDLLMEQALEKMRVPFFDGFIGTVKPFFDPYAIDEEEFPSRWAGLWKLHGSINWKYDEKEKNVIRGDMDKITETERRLIHPSHLKYSESRRMPYLAMLDKLKSFLRRPSCLLIISGYSFADEHINEVIRQGLERNIGAHCFALVYGPISNYLDAVKLAKNRSNLSLLAMDEGVIGGRKAPYIEKLGMETAEESTIGINWVSVNAIGSDDKKNKIVAQICLGDFAKFGELLSEIVGDEQIAKPQLGVLNAKGANDGN